MSTNSYLSHFMKPKVDLNRMETQSANTDAFGKSRKDMIKNAKQNCKALIANLVIVMTKTNNRSNNQSNNQSENDSDPGFAYAGGEGDEENSFKMDLSGSIKNPFGEAGDDSKNTFSSQFVDSPGGNHSDEDESPYELPKQEEKKKEDLKRKSSKQRKQWDKTANAKELKKQKTPTQMPKTNNESGEGDDEDDGDDSSFLMDFDELAKPADKKNEKNSPKKTKLPASIECSPKAGKRDLTIFSFNTESDAMLQYLHAVTCSLEDYLED